MRDDDILGKGHQLVRESAQPIHAPGRRAHFEPYFRIAERPHPFAKRFDIGSVNTTIRQPSDFGNLTRQLRRSRGRRGKNGSEAGDKGAPVHQSIT